MKKQIYILLFVPFAFTNAGTLCHSLFCRERERELFFEQCEKVKKAELAYANLKGNPLIKVFALMKCRPLNT